MAQVGTLVRVNANHVRVVSLSVGDVYKRIGTEQYGSKPAIVFGVVTDVLANGEQAAVMAVEYQVSYSDVEAKLVTLTDGEDVAVFPAQPDEVRVYFAEIEESSERKVRTKERELAEAMRRHDAVQKVLNSELRAPEITAITA